MLKLPPPTKLLPFLLSCFLFSGEAISSDNKPLSVDFLKGKISFIERNNTCIVKNRKINKVFFNEKHSRSEVDRCISECSYLLGDPFDFGSTNFHSCVAQCKGQIPLCDI